MKLSPPFLASLACLVSASPALAVTGVMKSDCITLLDKLAHCNRQTPDAARLACQKQVCTSYHACLGGTEPIAPIPQLAKLCSGVVASTATLSQAATPSQ